MPLAETGGHQFTKFTQTLREPKDDYTKRKIQKDRHLHIKWLNCVMKYKEIILTYKDGDEIKQEFVSTVPYNGDLQPFPDRPQIKEIVHGEEVLEDQYIRVYRAPDNVPLTIHIDEVLEWVTYTLGLNEIDKDYEATKYDD